MLGFNALGRYAVGQTDGVVISAGAAAGTGTASAIGTGINAAAGNAAGTSAATAVGNPLFIATASSAGLGGGNAVGFSFFAAIGNSSGIGAGGAGATSTAAVPATAAGSGVASGTGTGIVRANASTAAGVGAATATGLTFVARLGSAAGAGTAAATGMAIFAGAGNAAGTGTANTVSTNVKPGAGAAAGAGAAGAISFYFENSASTLKPDVDDTDGGWLNEVGSTSLFASIDDTAPNDGDYIISSDRPVSDICKIAIGNPSGGIVAPFAVLYRFKKQGEDPINLRVRLLEGTTEIAAWTHSDIAAEFLTVEQVLTAPQLATITDPSNLFFEFRASV